MFQENGCNQLSLSLSHCKDVKLFVFSCLPASPACSCPDFTSSEVTHSLQVSSVTNHEVSFRKNNNLPQLPPVFLNHVDMMSTQWTMFFCWLTPTFYHVSQGEYSIITILSLMFPVNVETTSKHRLLSLLGYISSWELAAVSGPSF